MQVRQMAYDKAGQIEMLELSLLSGPGLSLIQKLLKKSSLGVFIAQNKQLQSQRSKKK